MTDHRFRYEGAPDVPVDVTLKAWRRGHLPEPSRLSRLLRFFPFCGWRW